jgi:hypothetical protein
MWFTAPDGVELSTGKGNTRGLLYGSISLLAFTALDNIRRTHPMMDKAYFAPLALAITVALCVFTYAEYNDFSFLLLALGVAALNQVYRHSVLQPNTASNSVFERCIEITERAEKIFVLCFMPVVVLLILGRDDIPDCLMWSATLTIIGLAGLGFNTWQSTANDITASPIEKVAKIE